jgi:hypothetical protein
MTHGPGRYSKLLQVALKLLEDVSTRLLVAKDLDNSLIPFRSKNMRVTSELNKHALPVSMTQATSQSNLHKAGYRMPKSP